MIEGVALVIKKTLRQLVTLSDLKIKVNEVSIAAASMKKSKHFIAAPTPF